MNPQQLEKAALAYCEAKNLDPTERVILLPSDFGCRAGTRLMLVMEMLEEQFLIQQCISDALN